MCSEASEPIVCGFTLLERYVANSERRDTGRQDSIILKVVATSVLERSDKAVDICPRLTDTAEWAVRSGCSFDMRQIVNSKTRQFLEWFDAFEKGS